MNVEPQSKTKNITGKNGKNNQNTISTVNSNKLMCFIEKGKSSRAKRNDKTTLLTAPPKTLKLNQSTKKYN